MVTEINYTNIRRVLEDLLEHPMLSDLSLEQVIRHTVRFIAKHGYPKLYQDKIDNIEIKDFRGLLPCDLISIKQVKDLKSGLCLRSMTDNFPKGMEPGSSKQCIDPMNNVRRSFDSSYIGYSDGLTFKTSGRVIFTSIQNGEVQIAYKAMPVDDEGFPMLIDNEIYLEALENYIKVKVFTIKFDQGKISAGVLQNAQAEYAVSAKMLMSEFTTPSPSEMQSLANIWSTMIPQMRKFDEGFKTLGNREYLRKQ